MEIIMNLLPNIIIGCSLGSILGYIIANIKIKYENNKREKEYIEHSNRRLERDSKILD